MYNYSISGYSRAEATGIDSPKGLSARAGEGVPNKNFTHAWLAKNGATDAFAAKYAKFLAELDAEVEAGLSKVPGSAKKETSVA
jgi:hypothetical protein